MKKILPFSVNVPVKTYPNIAFYLGIIDGCGLDIKTLLFSEFTHIFYFRERIDFVSTGHFQKKYLENNYKNFGIRRNIENIIKEINKGNYVIIILNEKYIDSKETPSLDNYYHDWIIYGYDSVEEYFYCAGYFGRKMRLRQYNKLKIKFSDIQQSLDKSKLNHFWFTVNNTHTTRINHIPNEFQVNLANEHIKYMKPPLLKVYYNRPIINLDINALIKFRKMIIRKLTNWEKLKEKRIRLQSFRIIYEHFNVLEMLSECCITNEYINDIYKQITNKAYMLFVIAIKYNSKFSLHSLNLILNLLNEIIELNEELNKTILIDDYDNY